MDFNLKSTYKPSGDQPKAIEKLVKGLKTKDMQTLLGVTGSGKTFTMANIIQQYKKPTLVLSHNKSLAAQLYEEFKTFFPDNHVCFFVSYYDYYQPESYIKQTDTYIEKDVKINEKIDEYRMESISDLLTYKDVIVISSVSCIYNLGDPRSFENFTFTLKTGQSIIRQNLIKQLISIQYERNDTELKAGRFRVRGNIVDIVQGYGRNIIRVTLQGDKIDKIEIVHPFNLSVLEKIDTVIIFPASPFIFSGVGMEEALSNIEKEMKAHIKNLDLLEAHRLEQRTNYDIEMIRELGYCKGIENYSMYFDGRKAGQPPNCLLDYFPDDFLMFIDESHVSVPQVRGMYEGDKTRKKNLIENGFRLPSAYDNRPLKFDEFEKFLKKVIYVSATPAEYEFEHSKQVVEQIIRPTGLVDPPIEIRKTEGQMDDLIKEINETVEKGYRILVTTLTKRMAEELNKFLIKNNIRSHYLHSEIDTMERIEIIKDLRSKKFDVLIGINLLREGLDLPEVALVAILDADKQGFLRTDRSLIQTIGRAARNIDSKVIMYADRKSPAMKMAIKETNRRRNIQLSYNKKHNIIPASIKKAVSSTGGGFIGFEKADKKKRFYNRKDELIRLEAEMMKKAEKLDFEKAIELREEIKKIKEEISYS